MNYVETSLTALELRFASNVGVSRQCESIEKGRKDAHGLEKDVTGLDLHINGAEGEMALAKVIDRYWAGHINTFKGADVSGSIQVRTRSKHHYDLLVRPDDPPDDIYFHVTHEPGTSVWRVHGWMRGRDAQQPQYLKDLGNGRPAAYFVPASDLDRRGLVK